MAYNVSQEFREQCYSGESLYSCRLIIGGSTIPIEQIASITISSPIVDSNSETFYIGTFISQKLTIEFKNLDGIDTTSGTNVELYISQNVNGTDIEVPIGKYLIDESPENYYKSSKIDCLDYAIKFATNVDYSPSFVDGKTTIDNLLQWLCTYYGVTLGNYPNTNGNVEIGTYDSTVSGKRWISYIAEIKGCNAKMDRLGQLTLVPLKSPAAVTIDALASKSWELGEKFEVSKVTYFDAIRNYTFGDDTENTLILRQDNPFVVDESIVRNVYEKLRLDSSIVEEGTNFTIGNTIEGEPIEYLTLKGDTQQNSTILPSEYQQVEYIQSSGTQYIDTGLKGKNAISIDTDYSIASATTWSSLLGCANGTAGNSIGCVFGITKNGSINGGWYWRNTTNEQFDSNNVAQLDLKTNLKASATSFVFENTNGTKTYSFSEVNSFETTPNMYIFASNKNGTINDYSKIKLYYMKIFDGTTLKREYLPCYRISDNVIGLYDMVENKFYTNAGTGTFTKGSNTTLPTPDYPQEIHNVSGDNLIEICGKNLFDGNWIAGSVNLNTGEFTSTARNRTDFIRVIPNTQYTIWTGGGVTTYFIEYDKNHNFIIANTIRAVETQKTFTTNGNTEYAVLYQYTSYSPTNKVQLEKSSTATEYEEYKGQSQLISLGVENLLPSEITFVNKYLNYNGTTTSAPDWTLIDTYIEVQPSKTYKASCTNMGARFIWCEYDSSKQVIGNRIENATGIMTTSSTTKYIKFCTNSNTTDNWQLELGSKQNRLSTTPIELNKIGNYQDFIRKGTGKNLFDIGVDLTSWFQTYNNGLTINATSINRTTATISGSKLTINSYDNTGWTWISKWLELDKNTDYTISGTNTQAIKIVGCTSQEVSTLGTLIATKSSSDGSITFNTGNYDYYFLSFFPSASNQYLENIQLEKGSQPTLFEPYGFKDKWYLHKEIGKVVLDGSESWNLSEISSQYTTNRFRLTSKITPSIVNSEGLSNYFTLRIGSASDKEEIFINRDYFYISINRTRLSEDSVNGFKVWLNNNNVIVYDVLATPTYTEITNNELLEQLNSLEENAKTYGGLTNITSTCPITFKSFTSDPFICYSLTTENYGDISLDAWDTIHYTLGDEDYYTLNNNTITYEMTVMSKVETKIPTKQQEVTTNVVGGTEEQKIRRVQTTINNIDAEIEILAQEQTETQNNVSNLTVRTDSIENTVSSTTSNLSNRIDTLQSSTSLQINAINTQLENGVEKVSNSLVTIDTNGINTSRTGETFNTQITNKTFEVKDGNTPLLFAGYNSSTQRTEVNAPDLISERATVGVHRTEVITRNGKKRTAGFYVGGGN